MVAALLIALFNYFIDPYGIYNAPRFPGINEKKKEIANHLRMTKAHAVKNLRPAFLALGSSRVEYSIDPDYAAWGEVPTNGYNLGLAGSNIYEVKAYLKFAHRTGRLKKVVLGLDFLQFNIHLENKADFQEERLSGYLFLIREKLQTLLSVDTLLHSIETIFSQGDTGYEEYLNNGMKSPSDRFKKIREIGHRQFFYDSEGLHMHRIMFRGPRRSFEFSYKGASTFDTFREIVVFSYDKDIDLYMFISPVHARMQEAIRISNLWNKYESWKREMTSILSEEALKRSKGSFPLWDFSGYNEVTTENVPPRYDKVSVMDYYYDSSHYNSVVGNRILDRMFQSERDTEQAAPSFGVKLSPGNIDDHLKKIREARKKYEVSHPRDILEIKHIWNDP